MFSMSNELRGQAQGDQPWAWCHLGNALLYVLTLSMLSACTPGENSQSLSTAGSDGNHSPVIRRISLQPTPLVLQGPISVFVEAQDLDRDEIKFRYRWFVNGQLVAERSSETLEPTILKRGDQVVVEVVPSDGKNEGVPVKSQSLIVENSAPVVSHVTIEPNEESFSRRVLAKAEVMDPDGDSFSVTYRWSKNDKVVLEGESHELDITDLKTNDTIQVEVMATDGTATGKAVVSNVFSINNTPPTIVSLPTSAKQDGQYAYQVQAQDPDGDALTFNLEVAPPGMTIHPQSGLVQWVPAADLKASHRVRIVAKDSKGGFDSQDFELSLSSPGKS